MTTPTEKPRMFGLAGNHWETHSERVVCNNTHSNLPPSAVDVFSYFHVGQGHDARTIVNISEGPFTLSMRLDGVNARALAAALVKAADRADEVNAALAAEKAALKAFSDKARKVPAPVAEKAADKTEMVSP